MILPDIETIDLETLKIGVIAEVDKLMLEFPCSNRNVSLHTYGTFLAGNIAFRLTQKILGRHIETMTFERPRDWWEAVKQRFAPRWFLKRWPVKMHVDTVDLKAIYPGYAINQERYPHQIMVEKNNDFTGRYYEEPLHPHKR